MRESDLVVVGAGLAGLIAALTAAGRGRRAVILARGAGAIDIGCGSIDVLGRLPGGEPVGSFEEGLPRLPAEHPYARLGAPVVRAAMEWFCRTCAGAGYAYHGDLRRNRPVATAAGVLRPTALAPRSLDATPLFGAERVVVVGFRGLKDYFPRLAIAGLRRAHPAARWDEATVDLGREEAGVRDLSALDLARALDAPEARTSLVKALRPQVEAGAVVLVPPVLGSGPSGDVADELEHELGCRLVELAGMPPGVSGLRLRRLLLEQLRRSGVAVVENAVVSGAVLEGGRCRAVRVTGPDRERHWSAREFVLATGGYFGGGILAAPRAVREAVFGLPIAGLEDGRLSEADLFAGQPFARSGIAVNATLQPVDEAGAVVVENVRIVGANLAGADTSLERSGNGVAVASGFLAGTLA